MLKYTPAEVELQLATPKNFQAKVLHLVRHIQHTEEEFQYFKPSINLLVSFPDPPYDERTRERWSGEYSTKFLNIAEFPW